MSYRVCQATVLKTILPSLAQAIKTSVKSKQESAIYETADNINRQAVIMLFI